MPEEAGEGGTHNHNRRDTHSDFLRGFRGDCITLLGGLVGQGGGFA